MADGTHQLKLKFITTLHTALPFGPIIPTGPTTPPLPYQKEKRQINKQSFSLNPGVCFLITVSIYHCSLRPLWSTDALWPKVSRRPLSKEIMDICILVAANLIISFIYLRYAIIVSMFVTYSMHVSLQIVAIASAL